MAKFIAEGAQKFTDAIVKRVSEDAGAPDEDFYIIFSSEIKEKSLKLGEDLAKKVKASKR